MTGPEPPRRPPRERQGLTNGNGIPGLTNGSGRTNGLSGLTNGLVNGTGRTNGTRGRTSGITNGRGATNGTGAINGLINGSYKKGLRQNRFGVITHKDLRLGLSIIVLALLLLGPFYLLLSSPTPASPTRITVDGGLGDWSGIGFLNDTVVASDANVKLRAYSALLEPSGYLSFAIRVEGIALGDTTGFDGFYIFIDKDANPATGFSAREIGAEYLVAVRGGNNAVSSAALYGFTGTDPDATRSSSRPPTTRGWTSSEASTSTSASGRSSCGRTPRAPSSSRPAGRSPPSPSPRSAGRSP